MKKIILSFLVFVSISFADAKTSLYHLYQDKHYEDACKTGLKLFNKNRKDEEFISLYAFSCLYADRLDRLAVPITILQDSEESRSNAAYFSVILMQKKLLLHALMDNYQLNKLKLPTTEYILSIVYDLYSKSEHTRKQSFYTFKNEDNDRISYKLYIKNSTNNKNMVIEEYYDTIMTHRHIYW